jgi:hypothetical protein
VPLRREEVPVHGEGVRTDGRVCTVFWALSNCHRQIESNSNTPPCTKQLFVYMLNSLYTLMIFELEKLSPKNPVGKI